MYLWADTYFCVQGGDVFYFAHLGYFLLDILGQCDGREDGERTGFEAHCSCALAVACEVFFGHNIPIVPLPPIFTRPNLQNGTDKVVITRGTTSRITITLAGSEGTSFDDMLGYMNCRKSG